MRPSLGALSVLSLFPSVPTVNPRTRRFGACPPSLHISQRRISSAKAMMTSQRREPGALVWPHQVHRHRSIEIPSLPEKGRRNMSSGRSHGQPHQGSIHRFLFVAFPRGTGDPPSPKSSEDRDVPPGRPLVAITDDCKVVALDTDMAESSASDRVVLCLSRNSYGFTHACTQPHTHTPRKHACIHKRTRPRMHACMHTNKHACIVAHRNRQRP